MPWLLSSYVLLECSILHLWRIWGISLGWRAGIWTCLQNLIEDICYISFLLNVTAIFCFNQETDLELAWQHHLIWTKPQDLRERWIFFTITKVWYLNWVNFFYFIIQFAEWSRVCIQLLQLKRRWHQQKLHYLAAEEFYLLLRLLSPLLRNSAWWLPYKRRCRTLGNILQLNENWTLDLQGKDAHPQKANWKLQKCQSLAQVSIL